ncbi:MAG: hypothetical protein JSW63_10855 [Ignavibacterium sp.]|nr:MAG: hypothetical protein JSW63_10855 [Ignavibacterium sp.]
MTLFFKYWFICIIVLGINLSILPQNCKASLTIESDKESIVVFIDDVLAGSGKTVNVKLDPGTHKIVTAENTTNWDARSFIDTLNVKNCEDLSLKYKFTSDVLLYTHPQDVQVFSSDSLLGYTPLYIPAGLGDIRLEKAGYETTMVDYNDFENDKPVRLNFTGEVDSGPFFNKTLFKVLVGTMLALGAATAYFKLEADDKFAEYQITGENELLLETKRLDEISATTFVALQINFGLIIFFFLMD